ncbi:hypothetical protein TD95_002406 [Thielaviopsis punctulata]|uniref:Major facilitator superfamily (MFS) profile domain-containing protein n=1 Tax=Thielaviopsis punctulata TaxID=72032 RepID=A0A0F4ZAK0_9PEZI|nr:hypothetical protein TD95_002406 [Thielaviopsis punctulata]
MASTQSPGTDLPQNINRSLSVRAAQTPQKKRLSNLTTASTIADSTIDPPSRPDRYSATPTVTGDALSSPAPAAPAASREFQADEPAAGAAVPAGAAQAKQFGPPPDESDVYFQPKSLRFWLVMVSNFVAIFLVALDRTILATAIPKITDDFHTLNDIGWYGSAYMLTTAASQLLFGRIFKFYNVKWTYLATIVVFEVGSTICAAAPNSPVFIVGRAIAGIGSAGIFSGSMMIMIPMVPLPKRPMFQAVFGMVFGLSSVIGPLVGGGFTQALSWRWCFWINLPVGGVAFAMLLIFLDNKHIDRPNVPLWQHVMRLDPIGTFFFIPSVISLLLALQWGGSTYDWDNWRIVMLFVIFGMGFLAFAVVQIIMPKTATVPVHVICQRSMLAGAFFMLFLAGGMMMAIYYVPLWFQTVKQVSPVDSGIYTIPLVLSIVVSSVMSGIGIQKLGYYVPSMLLCPIIMAVGEGLLSTFTPHTSSSHWISFQFLTGFGLGFGMQVVNLAVQTVMPKEDVSTGIAISFFSQQLGAAVFVSVGQSILSNLLMSKLRGIPGISGRVVVSEGASSLHELVPAEYQDQVTEAYNYACTRVFFAGSMLCVATFASALFMQWRSIKTGGPGARGPPGAGGPAEASTSGDRAGPMRDLDSSETESHEMGEKKPKQSATEAV